MPRSSTRSATSARTADLPMPAGPTRSSALGPPAVAAAPASASSTAVSSASRPMRPPARGGRAGTIRGRGPGELVQVGHEAVATTVDRADDLLVPPGVADGAPGGLIRVVNADSDTNLLPHTSSSSSILVTTRSRWTMRCSRTASTCGSTCTSWPSLCSSAVAVFSSFLPNRKCTSPPCGMPVRHDVTGIGRLSLARALRHEARACGCRPRGVSSGRQASGRRRRVVRTPTRGRTLYRCWSAFPRPGTFAERRSRCRSSETTSGTWSTIRSHHSASTSDGSSREERSRSLPSQRGTIWPKAKTAPNRISKISAQRALSARCWREVPARSSACATVTV